MRQQVPVRRGWRKPPPPAPVTINVRGRRAWEYVPAMTGAPAAAAKPAFRHRHHAGPVAWLAAVVIAGAALHLSHRSAAIAIASGLIAAAVLVVFTRHLKSRQTRRWAEAAAVCTAICLPLIATLGAAPWLLVYFCCWIILAAWWGWQHRIRAVPELPKDAPALWAETLGTDGPLAGSHLTLLEHVPGGTRYKLHLVGGKHDTQTVFSASRKIASLFGRSVTDAFPERFRHAPEHEAIITLLESNGLQNVVEWDGTSISPVTGLAEIGDYPDGKPALFRFWTPDSGGTQSVVAGVTGSGKTALLYLLICIALASEVPVIPLVMDPQEGQSLPDARGAVPYAAGPDECMVMLRAIYAGVTARSRALSQTPWTDGDGITHPGRDRFDPHDTGLPLYLFVLDEWHIVLNHASYGKEAVEITGLLAKLNRKAGAGEILASHALLLKELGDNTLRAMVQSGNAIALRTGEGFTGGVIGLQADPKNLPQVFPDDTPTHGLGYMKGPSNRPDSPMRIRWVRNPRKWIMRHPVKPMDDVFAAAFRGSVIEQAATGQPGADSLAASLGIGEDEIRAAVEQAAARAAQTGEWTPLANAARPDDSPAPNGKTASDAILAALTRPMEFGELFELVSAKARGWDRKPWVLSGVKGPLRRLVADGKVARTPKPGRPDQFLYGPVRGGSR